MTRRYTIIGEEPSGIELQTSERTDIDNYQGDRVTLRDRRQQDRLRDEYDQATFRTDVHPEYNCHGLTFASKRTGIHDTEEVRTILVEDVYQQVERDGIMPGDVVLYFGADGDIEHSGIVLSVPEGRLNNPYVLSKWGNGGEAVHRLVNCPYDSTNTRFYRRLPGGDYDNG